LEQTWNFRRKYQQLSEQLFIAPLIIILFFEQERKRDVNAYGAFPQT